MNKKLVGGLLLALIFSLVVFIQVLSENRKTQEHINPIELKPTDMIKLPELAQTIQGKEVSLTGTIVFLFFDANCQSCVEEAPLWDHWSRKGANKRLKLIGVSRSEKSVLLDFSMRIGTSYDIVRDSDGSLFDLFGIRKIPNSAVTKENAVVIAPLNVSHMSSVRIAQIDKVLQKN